MKRRVLNFLTAGSLLALVATVPLWVRSYHAMDTVGVVRLSQSVSVESDAGRISLIYDRFRFSGGPPRWSFVRYRGFIWDASLIPPRYSILGVEWRTVAWPNSRLRALTVPYWMIAGAATVAPMLSVRRMIHRRSRRSDGRCAGCGYDLRATPDRCPECGAAPSVTTGA
jgi:hypothetical protein